MSLSYLDSFPPVDRKKLRGKSCLITGAGSGLGLTIAQAFSEAGAYVHIVDIVTASRGQEIVASLPGGQDHGSYHQCDVTQWEDQVQAFKAALNSSPGRALDVVVICAGIAGGINLVDEVSSAGGKDLQTDPEPPSVKVFQVNLIGSKSEHTFQTCSKVLKAHWIS